MTREVKNYEERREEILAIARRLFFSQGYGSTSVNEIIATIGIAKGTFYHYFDSKEDLMIDLADQITDEAIAIIDKIVTKTGMDAREKLLQVFTQTGTWKVQNREMMLELMRVMFDPENVRFRQILNKMTLDKAAPYIARIIHQGIADKIWDNKYPEEIARIIFSMGFGISDQFNECFQQFDSATESKKASILSEFENQIRAYNYAINRLLGARDENLELFDLSIIRSFFNEETDSR